MWKGYLYSWRRVELGATALTFPEHWRELRQREVGRTLYGDPPHCLWKEKEETRASFW